MENKFLNRVSELIQNKIARRSITAELESHILDKADYYEEIGYSKEVAIQKATEEMGNADDTAVPLNALHKNGKSKNLWSIITAVFAVAFSLLCFNVIPIEHLFRYGDASFSIVHSVTFDFLSMLICGAFLILLCKAYRQKNIVSSSLLVLSLIATAFAYFPDFTHPAFQFSLFQPFLYPAVMILKNGFTDFADSLFGYSYIPDSEQIFYHIGAVVIYLILLAVAVTLLIAIYRQSRMKTARILWIPIKIAKPVLDIVLAVSLLVMSITTVFALINIEDKQLEMQSAREKAIDFVINADVWGTDEQLKDDLLNAGYESYYS
ncbi:MAG: permease prefix domain 1-containing protein, partial [Ruminococcus sp.]|nr:permease prefix domain 1-containing protein [Ruminococcus sp.]